MAKAASDAAAGTDEAAQKRTPRPAGKWGFRADNAESLIRIVKEAQRRGIEGSKGSFKEFAKKEAKGSVAWKADPAAHNWRTLADFAETLEGTKLAKMVKRQSRWDKHQRYFKSLSRWQAGEDRGMPKGAIHPAWGLVARTEAHLGFKKAYAFPSHEKGWVLTARAPREYSAGGVAPVLLAVDCEMCDTTAGPRQLLGVSVVGGARGEQLLLKTLVKPEGEVLDFKFAITGITAKDLEGVDTTLKDVQAKMKELLAPNVILVGHSLHHDLRALKIDHQPCIDTSMIFSYKDLPKSTPGLSDLSKMLLKEEMRQNEAKTHDSAEDATYAMRLVEYEVAAGPTGPLAPPDTKVDPKELKKLLIHRIPVRATEQQLRGLFPGHEVLAVEGDLGEKKSGKCTVVLTFASVDAANAAFKDLEGRAERDSIGRPQKASPLPPPPGGWPWEKAAAKTKAVGAEQGGAAGAAGAAGDAGKKAAAGGKAGPAAPPAVEMKPPVVCVRKMAAHGGAVFGSDAKSTRGKRPDKPKAPEAEVEGGPKEAGGVPKAEVVPKALPSGVPKALPKDLGPADSQLLDPAGYQTLLSSHDIEIANLKKDLEIATLRRSLIAAQQDTATLKRKLGAAGGGEGESAETAAKRKRGKRAGSKKSKKDKKGSKKGDGVGADAKAAGAGAKGGGAKGESAGAGAGANGGGAGAKGAGAGAGANGANGAGAGGAGAGAKGAGEMSSREKKRRRIK